MRLLVVLFLGLAMLAHAAEAHACSCIQLTPSEGLTSSHVVFSGEVTKIAKNEATRFGGLEVTLRVKDVWKGEPRETMKVHTAASGAACGYPFVEGETYLVYAISDEADPMRVSLCGRTAPIDEAKEDLDYLGKPAHRFNDKSRRKNRQGEASAKDDCSASPIGARPDGAAFLMLALAVLALAVRRLT